MQRSCPVPLLCTGSSLCCEVFHVCHLRLIWCLGVFWPLIGAMRFVLAGLVGGGLTAVVYGLVCCCRLIADEHCLTKSH